MLPETRQLLSKSAVYSLGNILIKLIAFLLIPLYARKLVPDEYGVVAILELVEILGETLLSFGLANSILRYYVTYREQKRANELIFTICIFLLISNSLIVALLLNFPHPLVDIFLTSSPAHLLYFRYTLLVIFSGVFKAILVNIFMAEEKAHYFIAFTLLNFMLLLGLNIYKVGFRNEGVLGIVESKLIVALFNFAIITVYLFVRFRMKFSWATFKESFSYGGPLVFGGISLILLTLADRYLLKELGTMADVGIYSMSYKFGMLINMVLITPFRQALYPLIFRMADQQEIKNVYVKFLTFYLFVGFVFFLAISSFAREILMLFTSPQYFSGHIIVPFITISYFLFGVVTIFIGIIATGKKTTIIAYSTLAGAAVNILLNIYLIPKWGIMAAAVATVAAYGFITVVTFILQQRMYAIQWDWQRIRKITLTAAGIYALTILCNSADLLLAIFTKTLLVLAFPLLLYLWGFFHRAEIEDLKRIATQLMGGKKSINIP